MNLGLISSDIELNKELKKTNLFELIMKENLEDIEAIDILLISDKQVDFNELSSFINSTTPMNLSGKKIFYMLSNAYSEDRLSNIKSLSRTKRIIIIPPKLTVVKIVEKIINDLFPNVHEKGKNVITFLGADSKVGTTMIIQSTAELLARSTDARILLMFLNGSQSTEYISKRYSSGLDDIKIKLMNNILHPEELEEACIYTNQQLYILPGVEDLLDVRHYHPEHIEKLIDIAAQRFHLILIDIGSNIDSGMAVASLNSSKYKYLVTTQQETARKKFKRLDRQVFKLLQIDSSSFMLIINKFLNSSHIYSAKQIADQYNMTLAINIPHLEFLGWQAEYDQKTLVHYENQLYNQQIENLSSLVSEQVGIKYKKDKVKQEGILRKALNTLGGIF